MSERGRRVVVSGLGAVTPFGRGLDATWQALLSGRSVSPGKDGVARIRGYEAPANLNAEAADRLGRCSLFAADAAIQAVEDARLPFTAQTAPLIGVSLGSHLGERDRQVAGAPATSVARVLGVAGPARQHFGPAAGAVAVGEAFEAVFRGAAPIVVAGAAEAFEPGGRPSIEVQTAAEGGRPFDAGRDGALPSEGAVALCLEDEEIARERGARVYGEVLGWGSTFSRATVMAPAMNHLDPARAMRSAFLRAGVLQGEVDVVFASSWGAPDGDAFEARAMRDLWGPNVDRLTVTSVHGGGGYGLSVAGPLALAVALRSLGEETIPPAVGCGTPDSYFGVLDIVLGEARPYRYRTAMVNAFSHASNVSLLIRAAQR